MGTRIFMVFQPFPLPSQLVFAAPNVGRGFSRRRVDESEDDAVVGDYRIPAVQSSMAVLEATGSRLQYYLAHYLHH